MIRRRLFPPLVAAFAALVVSASSAQGAPGDYEVKSCFSDTGHYSTRAFSSFATRGMRLRRTCNPRGRGLRGLTVGNVPKRRAVKRNARASMTITAAPGTVFQTLQWSGDAARSDCAYGIDLYASGPGVRGGRRTLLARSKAPYKNCRDDKPGTARSSFTGRSNDVRGATRITQRIICKPQHRTTCRARASNYMKLQQVSVSVRDVQPPSVQITGGSLFGGWVRGDRSVTYDASDNVGIRTSRLLLGGGAVSGVPRACDQALVVPCPNGGGQIQLHTQSVGEGTVSAVVETTDASGLVGQSLPAVSHVDNTAPTAAPLTLAGGDGWRATNGYAIAWTNPAEPDRAPITAAHYRVCRVGGSCGDAQTAGSAGIQQLSGVQVSAPGEWTLRMWREDAAGNTDERAASPAVTLRYDPEAPRLAFDAVDTTDPTLLKASISDPLSGVAAGGTIEVSREGSNVWQALATTLVGDRLQARVDDSTLPAGRYLLRAAGSDNAGNRGSTTQRSDGSTAVITLPLRAEARLSVGFVRHKRARRAVRRHGKRRVTRRRVTRLVARAHVRQDRIDTISGRLVTNDGSGLPNAAVYAFSRVAGRAETYAGLVNTDVGGRFRYRVRGDASRTVRFVYLGAPSIRPATQSVEMIVPGRTSFGASPRHLLNGQRVVFRGRLGTAPAGLAEGKSLELQTRLSGGWQTFRNIKTDVKGRWQSAYRFRRTRGSVAYRFRARIPTEAGYPYGIGLSRTIKIGVRGR